MTWAVSGQAERSQMFGRAAGASVCGGETMVMGMRISTCYSSRTAGIRPARMRISARSATSPGTVTVTKIRSPAR